MVAVDLMMDCGLWWHLIVVEDPNRGGSSSWIIISIVNVI